jgi:hypothetical protein
MYAVQVTSTALKAMATALGKGVDKKLLRSALTKVTIFPIVQSVETSNLPSP